MIQKIHKEKAFTLIELLVVIAIIALLMAILVPVLRSARNQARMVICQSNLKQWSQILNLYTQDTEGRLPDNTVHLFLYILRGPFETSDNQRVSSYCQISTEGISCCPMATTRPGDSAEKGTWSLSREPGVPGGEIRYGSTFRAWEMTGLGSPFRCSYGLNGHFLWGSRMGVDTFSVEGSAKIPVFLDARSIDGEPESYDDPPLQDSSEGRGFMDLFCINRHNGYINGLFLDWSVRKVGLKELWTLKWSHRFDTANEWTKAGGVQPEDWPEWMRNFKDY